MSLSRTNSFAASHDGEAWVYIKRRRHLQYYESLFLWINCNFTVFHEFHTTSTQHNVFASIQLKRLANGWLLQQRFLLIFLYCSQIQKRSHSQEIRKQRRLKYKRTKSAHATFIITFRSSLKYCHYMYRRQWPKRMLLFMMKGSNTWFICVCVCVRVARFCFSALHIWSKAIALCALNK